MGGSGLFCYDDARRQVNFCFARTEVEHRPIMLLFKIDLFAQKGDQLVVTQRFWNVDALTS